MSSHRPAASALRIAVLFPELLGTYGDGGNVLVLQRRLEWRGLDSQTVPVALAEPIPTDCDLYVLGGGEDLAQAAALTALRRSPGLHRAAARGTPVLAVCAGLQLLGATLTDREGVVSRGLGLLDLDTRLGPTRLVGDVVAVPDPLLELPALAGFANHAGRTRLGPQARPLATVLTGPGNDDDGPGASQEGAQQGSIVASYLHGPVLARNPHLADLVLSRALGRSLEPLDLGEADAVRAERFGAARNVGPQVTRAVRRSAWGGRAGWRQRQAENAEPPVPVTQTRSGAGGAARHLGRGWRPP